MKEITLKFIQVQEPVKDENLEKVFEALGREASFRMILNHLRDLAQQYGGKYYDAFQNFQSAEELSKD